MTKDCPPVIKLEDPNWCIEYTIKGWWDNFLPGLDRGSYIIHANINKILFRLLGYG